VAIQNYCHNLAILCVKNEIIYLLPYFMYFFENRQFRFQAGSFKRPPNLALFFGVYFMLLYTSLTLFRFFPPEYFFLENCKIPPKFHPGLNHSDRRIGSLATRFGGNGLRMHVHFVLLDLAFQY